MLDAPSTRRFVDRGARLLGKHHQRTPEGTEARLSLLAPIAKQNEAIGQYLRARRAVGDVNPDTGEDEPSKPGETEVAGGGTGNQ